MRDGWDASTSLEALKLADPHPVVRLVSMIAAKGNVVVVRKLLEHGVQIDASDASGHTALQLAILAGRTRVADVLVASGAALDADALLLEAASTGGIPERAAILAGVLPLRSAEEAELLRDTYTDMVIPDAVIERLKAAGDPAARQKEGLSLCIEMIK